MYLFGKNMKITVLTENTISKNAKISKLPLQGEHGLSLFIQTQNNNILFDMGQTNLFAKNASLLGINLQTVDFAILSHGHYDHGGLSSPLPATLKNEYFGIEAFAHINKKAPIFINSNAFSQNYNASKKYIGLNQELLQNKIAERFVFVQDEKEITQIASISAGSDEIGELISSAFKQVGKDGVITIEESKTSQTQLKITQGLEFDRGYLSPYMASPNQNYVCLENPYILVTDKKLTNINDLLPILEQISQSSRPLLIIADDVDGEVLSTLILNNMRGSFRSVAVKCPSFGDKQKAFLQDIALLTSASFISKDFSFDLKSLTLEHLGEAQIAKITKDKTTIVGGKSNIETISDKISHLKESLQTCTDEYEKINLEDQLARLSGGVAVIEVGANSEIEMREKKLRIEDALSATKSASKEGIVIGGGCALVSCIPELKAFASSLYGDEKTGAEIVLKAIESPIRQIAVNAGVDDGVVLNEVLKNIDKNIGYNALEGTYENMFESGIIDPTKVTRCALENAGSVAASILTTDVIITDIPEQKIQ
jgi:chaperonin GroEL